jgi:acyl-CoA synthetase (AMP-forming)/AMP-acid ligase II/acyl carrier protein
VIEAGTVHGSIAHRARQDPEGVALLAPGYEPLGFRALLEQIEFVVASLNAIGVKPGDTVGLLMPGGPELAAALLAVSAGAAVAPLNPAYRERELADYLEDLAPKALLVQHGMGSPARAVARVRGIGIVEVHSEESGPAGRIRLSGHDSLGERGQLPAPEFAGPEDVALLLHTSGTTSRPKVVPLTQRNIHTSAADVCRTLRLGEMDRCLNLMPLYHVGGLVDLMLAPLSVGGSVVCTPGFSAAHLMRWFDEYEPTWFQAVPTMLQEIAHCMGAAHPSASPRLRFVRSVAAALPDALRQRIEELFSCSVVETYGMTEAAPLITSTALPPDPCEPGSLGRSVGPDVAIMNPRGEILSAYDPGEIVVRGDNVMAGYLNAPDANARSFRGDWFRTGDLGYMDEHGFLFLRGRVKEMINRGGEKISPSEVDRILLEHPDVAEVACFAVPHRTLGEEVGAAVVPTRGASITPADLTSWVRERLSDFKAPRVVHILAELPRNRLGKVQRIGLAAKLGLADAENDSGSELLAEPRDDLEGALRELWQDVLEVAPIGIHDKFFDLGGSSLSAVTMFAVIEEELGEDVPLEPLLRCETIEELATMLRKVCPVIDEGALTRIREGGSGL